MATAMGKTRQREICSPVRGGIGAVIVARQTGSDAAPLTGLLLKIHLWPLFATACAMGYKTTPLRGLER